MALLFLFYALNIVLFFRHGFYSFGGCDIRLSTRTFFFFSVNMKYELLILFVFISLVYQFRSKDVFTF